MHDAARTSRFSRWDLIVVAGAFAIAALSARNYAGSWNDGSRLAAVESLVDRHTLQIDDSIFVRVPDPTTSTSSPYLPDDPFLRHGTADKLLIDDHYYSDKSPVPALLMAGLYQVVQSCCGLVASDRPDWFCYVMTLGSTGLAYVVAVWCVFRLGRSLWLSVSLSLLLAASLALATVALPYSRQVNNHVLLLGVAAALLLGFANLRGTWQNEQKPWRLLFASGSLVGLGYTIDLGVGPVLLVSSLGLVAYRCGPIRPALVFALGALPWLLLHHAVNYAVGGTFKPANANPEYFLWPGCPFTPENLTGGWAHRDLGHFVTYAAALLFGKRGFFGHNLPLILLIPAAAHLLRKRLPERAELVYCAFLCGGVWLTYAMASNNYSGQCCSIRWFVPLLAPAYFCLALFVREHRRFRTDLLLLSGWGALMAGLMWWYGPWMKHMVPAFWTLQGGALAMWAVLGYWRRRRALQSQLEPSHAMEGWPEAA